jgi:iron complex outermembrane recepter protein
MKHHKSKVAILLFLIRNTPSKKQFIVFLIFIFLFTSLAGFSQRTTVIKGIVKDENQQPFAAANISLLRAKDSMLVKTAFTDKDGVYAFEGVNESNYLIIVTATGYKKFFTQINVIDGTINVPSIILATEIKGLKEVTVQTQKPLFEQKSDKMIVNVNASPSNAGANALEILEKSPGITVDRDGNISLKGKAGVQIFIDGKPSYISGADLVNFLRNLQGTQLDQIEIMTNPPAKYDATGNSGIINIKTKKVIQLGYSVTFTAGYTQGIYARNNQDINFNYRKNKVNLFGTLSHNERNTIRTFILDRKFVDPVTKEVKTLLSQQSDKLNWNASNSFKLGSDFFITKRTTIGTVVNGFYNPENSVSTGTIFISNPYNVLLGSTFSKSTSKSSWENISANINLRHVFDSTGKELTADLDYVYYAGANAQNLSNYFYNPSGVVTGKPDTLYGNLPQLISIYSAKADYIHPLRKGGKLEAGAKAAYVKTNANALYDSLINNKLIADVGRSNHFVYDERISAAYVSYSQPLSKKLNGQLGLRFENTLAHGNQLTTGERFTLNYTQLFPTAYLSYKANEKNTWTMNYGRRIRRPDYESLNPFVKFLDRYTFEQGNPNLRPQFSHNVELSHSFNSFITTTLNYTKTTNIIQMVIEQNENTNQTFGKQTNIANQRQYGIAVNIFKQANKFTGNLYVNIYNNEFSGVINNSYTTIGATTAIFNTSTSYKFKNGIITEVNGFYRTAGVEGIFRISALGAVNFGASIPLLKNKATLRLSVRDFFWTQKAFGKVRFGTIDTKFQMIPDSRTIGLNFSYRLSKGKLTTGKRKAGGAGDEQNRVKGSDN